MPLTKFNPLANDRTSAVLLLLMQEVDTPTGLARQLKVKPPSIMEQLGRLRKIQVIELAEKTGREQHYRIDWDALTTEIIHRTIGARHFRGRRRDSAKFAKAYPGLKAFLKKYFEVVLGALADQSKSYSSDFLGLYPTVSNWMSELHSALIVAQGKGLFGRLLIDDPALERFSKPLRSWAEMSQPVDPAVEAFLVHTLIELGFKSRSKSATPS